MSVSKKKTPTKTERSKGIELRSEAAILKEARMKRAIKRSKPETDIHQAGGSSEGASLEPEVPDEQKGKSTDTNSDDDNDDDQQSDDEQNVSNNPWTSDDEEETQKDEFVHTREKYVPTDDENVNDEEYERINKEMYDDVNVELKVAETADEMIDAKKVDVENENVNQEVRGDQVNYDAHATVIAAPATQKTEFSYYAAIKSEFPTVVKEYFRASLDDTLHKDEDAMDKGVAEKLKKRKPDDSDRDEGPLARPDQELKRKKMGKDTEPSKKKKSTRSTTTSQPKSIGNST
uniref:Uncharacterized protein n=1 Tax=Tanacetum cinerariifolium TaxID=118510 RepID=A0A699HPL4_TANCI|nr:hypothetical protein [Tanacetum cinerariifolium]